jgi:hypothetical protein
MSSLFNDSSHYSYSLPAGPIVNQTQGKSPTIPLFSSPPTHPTKEIKTQPKLKGHINIYNKGCKDKKKSQKYPERAERDGCSKNISTRFCADITEQ